STIAPRRADHDADLSPWSRYRLPLPVRRSGRDRGGRRDAGVRSLLAKTPSIGCSSRRLGPGEGTQRTEEATISTNELPRGQPLRPSHIDFISVYSAHLHVCRR